MAFNERFYIDRDAALHSQRLSPMADPWRASITSALRKGGRTSWVDATQLELVALRVPAKVVVIVENENARRGFALTIEISGLETAGAAANDDEVVGLGRARRLQREIAVAELVRQLERPRMAAPQADSTSAEAVLLRPRSLPSLCQGQATSRWRSSGRNSNTIEEIARGDRLVHASHRSSARISQILDRQRPA